MRVFLPLLFLTLVVSSHSAMSAPQTTTTVETSPFSAKEDPELAHLDPEQRNSRPTSIFNFSLGFAGGNFLERDEYQQGVFFALRYIPLEDDKQVWDYQLEVNKDNLVGGALGRRWYCCPGDTFEPYVRASANLFLKGSGELGGIAELRRWRLRGAVGIGETFISEFGVGYAITGPDLYAQFGYNFLF